jgi:hypothetical protein
VFAAFDVVPQSACNLQLSALGRGRPRVQRVSCVLRSGKARIKSSLAHRNGHDKSAFVGCLKMEAAMKGANQRNRQPTRRKAPLHSERLVNCSSRRQTPPERALVGRSAWGHRRVEAKRTYGKAMSEQRHRIPVVASRTTLLLGLLALLLLLASIAGQLTKYLTRHVNVYGLVPLFNVDGEGNVPAFFSALLLLFAATLLGIIAILKRAAHASYASHWAILASIFLYLAFDEATSIHELLARPTNALLGDQASGLLYYSWIIPGIAFILLLALTFAKFLLHLHARTRWLFLASALLFVAGAVGVEAASGLYVELHGWDNWTYNMIAALEEALEMAGVIVFIYALLEYIQVNYDEVGLRFLSRKMDQP